MENQSSLPLILLDSTSENTKENNLAKSIPCSKTTQEMVQLPAEQTDIASSNNIDPEKYPQKCNDPLNDFFSKIGFKQTDSIENYKQLVYDYHLKAEDLDNKCRMFHRNLQDMEEALEKAKISKDLALKEKENMTLKFAKGEKIMLLEKESKEKYQKKCRELSEEIEKLHRKIEINTQDKTKLSSMYDNKIHELKTIQSENNRIKEENYILRNELKLCQIAMKNQAELYTKSQNIIETLNTTIENLSKEKTDKTEYLENLEQKLKKVEIENNLKKGQLKDLQTTFNNINLNNPNQHICESSSDSREDEIKKFNVNEPKNISDELNRMLNRLQTKNEDLENDIKSYQIKEAETLSFNQQLSEKNVELLSKNLDLQNVLQNLTIENNELKDKCTEFNKDLTMLSQQVAVEKELSYQEKKSILSELDGIKENLAEVYRQNSMLKQQLHDQQEQCLIMRKKYDSTQKELKKEIKQSKYNKSICLNDVPSSVSTVLKDTELSYTSFEDVELEDKPTKLDLTDPMISLQNINVEKSEKIDILEDRIESLQLELRKKDTLLQYYFLREKAEILVSTEMLNAKFNICKLGGVMASIYDARVADENLTSKLLLEINCKLHTVLQDVLLQNIILKNNIEILGKEIEHLNQRTNK